MKLSFVLVPIFAFLLTACAGVEQAKKPDEVQPQTAAKSETGAPPSPESELQVELIGRLDALYSLMVTHKADCQAMDKALSAHVTSNQSDYDELRSRLEALAPDKGRALQESVEKVSKALMESKNPDLKEAILACMETYSLYGPTLMFLRGEWRIAQ